MVAVVLGLIASTLIGDGQNISDERGEQIKALLEGAGLVLGIGVFLFAMWWDSSDPRRETRRSDVAFWLHLLSAPLIVHPIFSLLGLTEGTATTWTGSLCPALCRARLRRAGDRSARDSRLRARLCAVGV